MLVAFSERAREIRMRFAIGGLERKVLLRLLVEAVVLCCVGGLSGIVLAVLVSSALARFIQVPFLFNLHINGAASFFSGAIGLVFGYLPSRRTSARSHRTAQPRAIGASLSSCPNSHIRAEPRTDWLHSRGVSGHRL